MLNQCGKLALNIQKYLDSTSDLLGQPLQTQAFNNYPHTVSPWKNGMLRGGCTRVQDHYAHSQVSARGLDCEAVERLSGE